jgi:hypothetical protein
MNTAKTTARFPALAAAALLGLLSASAGATPPHVLVVTVTQGFRHSSIPTAERVLAELGRAGDHYTVEFAAVEPTEPQFRGADGKPDATKVNQAIKEVLARTMSVEALKRYDAVIFANPTGVLPLPDKEGFLNWIRSGKGFVGMHSASDCFHARGQVDPFIEMLGGEFETHHEQVAVECWVQDPQHPSTKHFGPTFHVFDEIYLLKNFHRHQVRGLLTLDKHPNTGHPGDYPISWCKLYGQGRVFYTSLGHREDVWDADPSLRDRKNTPDVSRAYQQHILGGIRWAMGQEQGDATPQSTRAKLSEQEEKEGFRPLFNGENLAGWRLRQPDGRPSWSAQNGMLVNTITKDKEGKEVHGTDLVSEAKFGDFEVRYEFMVPKASNSGFYLRGRHELQILDDYGSSTPEVGGNGAFYSLKAPDRVVSRAPGQWQEARVTLKGNRVTVVLNGVKIHDQVELTRATGGELDRNVGQPGPFLLQGDHGAIAFRNLRVRPM